MQIGPRLSKVPYDRRALKLLEYFTRGCHCNPSCLPNIIRAIRRCIQKSARRTPTIRRRLARSQ
jgi:hypothetical protein